MTQPFYPANPLGVNRSGIALARRPLIHMSIVRDKTTERKRKIMLFIVYAINGNRRAERDWGHS
jgi:hypothetical protein